MFQYPTRQVVEVVCAACSVLEKGGVGVQVTVQQAIKNLKAEVEETKALLLVYL